MEHMELAESFIIALSIQDPKLITCVIYAKSPVSPIVSMTID